jgi:hypothetical protein
MNAGAISTGMCSFRFTRFYSSVALALAFVPISMWCQTINRVEPYAISVNKTDKINVTLFGSNLESLNQVFINCSQTPFRVTANKDKKGNVASVTLTILPAQREQPGILLITTVDKCDPDTAAALKTGVLLTVTQDPVKPIAPLGQTLVGLDVAAASSATPRAVFLGAATLDIPFAELKDDVTLVHWWLSGNLKIAGMAQPGDLSNANLSSASAFSGFLGSATGTNATPDKIVQSLELSAAIGASIGHGWRLHGGMFDTGTRPADPYTHITTAFIIGGGAITPLSVSQSSPPVYEATQQIQQLFPNPTNFPYASSCAASVGTIPACFVSFIPVDRSHFYRHYEAGFRFRIYGEDNNENQLRFPGTIDLAAGQNEYVTGGCFCGSVLHVGGTLPVPVLEGFYAFGSMDLALSNKHNNGNQLLLIPAPSNLNLTFTSSQVYTISVLQPNRDRYMIGFGIDFYRLYQAVRAKGATQ